MKKNILYFNTLNDIKVVDMMRNDVKYKPYNPSDFKHAYLTTEVVYNEGYPIEISIGTDGYYSLDNAKTWKHIGADETIELNEDAKILWRDFTPINATYGTFSISEPFDVYGNAMSLVNGKEYPKLEQLPGNNSFIGLFQGSYVQDAKNLILPTRLTNDCFSNMFANSQLMTAPQLPATTLADSCYTAMFEGTQIEESPILPAVEVAESCYSGMFSGCSNLSKITAYFTRDPEGGMDFTQDWVKNVSDSGVFVKNSAATWNVQGDNGIPMNWTVQTVVVN